MLEAEVEALKTLVITSTPSKPGFRRRSTEQLSSCNSCGSVHCMNLNNNIHLQNDGKSDGTVPRQEREVYKYRPCLNKNASLVLALFMFLLFFSKQLHSTDIFNTRIFETKTLLRSQTPPLI